MGMWWLFALHEFRFFVLLQLPMTLVCLSSLNIFFTAVSIFPCFIHAFIHQMEMLFVYYYYYFIDILYHCHPPLLSNEKLRHPLRCLTSIQDDESLFGYFILEIH
jgi:hypothetical protein